MEWVTSQQKDLGHRLLEWTDSHQRHLVVALAGGVAFLGLLAGLMFWFSAKENQAQEALYNTHNNQEALEKLIHEFPKTNAALFALIDLAQKNQDDKNFDACISQYQTLYEKSGKQVFFRVLALHGVAGCYKAKGDFQKAAEIYERAAKEPGHLDPLLSRFEAGRCLELSKDPKTEITYKGLLEEKSLSPELKNKIEEQLLWFRLQKKS